MEGIAAAMNKFNAKPQPPKADRPKNPRPSTPQPPATPPAPPFAIELNKVETVENTCTAYFIVRNTTADLLARTRAHLDGIPR